MQDSPYNFHNVKIMQYYRVLCDASNIILCIIMLLRCWSFCSGLVHALSSTGRLMLTFVHLDGEGVLLVAAHVGIAHEVEDVFVCAGRWRSEIHFHFRL